jgi:hypothetical protein
LKRKFKEAQVQGLDRHHKGADFMFSGRHAVHRVLVVGALPWVVASARARAVAMQAVPQVVPQVVPDFDAGF